MEFKRHWGIIWQVIFMMVTIGISGSAIIIYGLAVKDQVFTTVIFFCFGFVELMLYLTLHILPGIFSDVIVIGKQGISLVNKDRVIHSFYWDDIERIFYSNKLGTNTLVVLNKAGEDIWFYRNKKIEKYILLTSPTMKDKFSRKQEPWVHRYTDSGV